MFVEVFINKKDNPKDRVVVKAKVVKENKKTVLVELSNGDLILRKKDRDFVQPTVFKPI